MYHLWKTLVREFLNTFTTVIYWSTYGIALITGKHNEIHWYSHFINVESWAHMFTRFT